MLLETENIKIQSKGCFITLEGIDGAGKSTHLNWLVNYLQANGIKTVQTREPGGTALAEQLRNMLLHQNMHLTTEALLMFAARNEHVHKVISPALSAGAWVVCDRFTDASYAYQGGGRGLRYETLTALENIVHPDLQPNCTFLFDLPLDIARERLNAGASLDRFEHEQRPFFERTQAAYHERANQYPQRFCIIDSSKTIQDIRIILEQKVSKLIQAFKLQQC